MTKKIQNLSPKEVLGLAIAVEQSNGKALRNFAEMFEGYDSEVSKLFREMSDEENKHEELLQQMFQRKFKEPVPTVDPFDIEEVVEAYDFDDSEHLIFDSLRAKQVYQLAYEAENRAKRFYEEAAKTVKDKELGDLFKKLVSFESDHAAWLEEKRK